MAIKTTVIFMCDICGTEYPSNHGERTVFTGEIKLENEAGINGAFDICGRCKEKLAEGMRLFFETRGKEIEEKFLSCNCSENKDLYYSCSNCTFQAKIDEICDYKFCPICGLELEK